MTPEESITAYFKDVATRHPSILHTTAVPRFFEMEWEDMQVNGGELAAESTVLVLEEYTERLRDNDADYISLLPTIAIQVGKHVMPGDRDGKKAAWSAAREICYDIVGKMKEDELDPCNADVPDGVDVPRLVDLSTVSVQKLKLKMFDNAYGCRLTVRIRHDKQIILTRNRVAWVTLP